MPIITDGAWGTQLQAAGLAPGECPDAWNLTRPAVMQRLRAASTLPWWAKPNAGMPVLEGDATVFRCDPLVFAEHAQALVGAGAIWIGACCGSSPAVIAALQAVR